MVAAVRSPTLDPAQIVVDAFKPVAGEADTMLPILEGRVPAALRGVLYRNGPGRLEVFGTQLTHPFDGDGMVSRFRFENGGIHYRNRFVRTAEFEAEARAGRMLYRNFGTARPGGLAQNLLRLKFKNPANTSVLRHGDQLLALWEGGQPHALDPETLETLGRFDFGGRLNAHASAGQSWTDRWLQAGQRWLSMEAPFSAHPRRCATTGQVYNFGLQVAPVPTLLVYCIDPQGKLQSTRQIRLPRVAFMHDFVLTANHAVFFMTPVRFDVGRALLGLSSPVESIRRAPGVPTEILLVPRDGGAVRRIALDAGFFLFHFFNAFEANGSVVVDGCRMDDFPGGTVDLSDIEAVRRVTLDPGYPTRWRINLSDGTVSTTRLSEIPMELPTIDPRRSAVAHRFGYATARLREGPPVYTGLARIDFTHGTVWTRDFSPDLPGEPMLLPFGNDEGEGVLASVIYRAAEHISELTLLDPENLQTVARARLPHHQPPGFHGDFQRSFGPG